MSGVICATCKNEGRTSKVYCEGGSVTLLHCPPFYDEAGVYHSHDSNRRTTGYRCSNGHMWAESSYAKCPSCDWGHPERKETK